MTTSASQDGERRRGRRPGGADTRAALLTAAREMFAENGYEGATVRAIARRAGVDPAMVNHWFGSKEALFTQSVLQLPVDPRQIIGVLLDGDREDIGERMVRTFLTTWDAQGGGVFAALVRSIASHEGAAHAMRDFFVHKFLGQVVAAVTDDRPMLRANLVASQVIGLGMIRYVAHFEPVAKTDVDTLALALGPTLQRYLTGEID